MERELPILDVIDVTKVYEGPADAVPVLKGVNLRVRAGESVAIVGPSGSGKSTLLHMIGSLDRPTAGQILFDGRDIARLSEDGLAALRARQMGFVFQLHYLLPQCSVLENVLLPSLVADGSAAVMERARRLLDRVALSSRLAHRPGQLSVGECQRAALVRALVNGPRLLLADEPTGSLDRTGADEMATLLVELNREEGVTLIVVTHSTRLAGRMQRVLELRDGALAEPGGQA